MSVTGNDLSDKSLPAIPTSFPHLECLCLAHCRRFSSDGLYSMLAGQKHLKQIDLAGCTQLNHYEDLQQEIHSLRPHLHLVGNNTRDPQLVHRCFRFN